MNIVGLLFCNLAYQNEIDNITKRSKTAETAYLNLYKKLVDAPDPTPLIAAAVVCPFINK